MTIQEEFENNKILEILTGSRLYGTHGENSDYDIRGVSLPGEKHVFGFEKVEQVEYENDKILMEFRKFVTLALDNNPNILELLFAKGSNILYINEFGKGLLNMKEKFLHIGLVEKFLGYSRSQKHKMYIKKENYKILKDILSFLLGQLNHRKFLNEIKHENIIFEQNYIKIADLNFQKGCKVHKAITIIKNRLGKVSYRTKTGNECYDTKFAMNLIRLLYECVDYLNNGYVEFPFQSDRLSLLMEIKNGKWFKEDIIKYSEQLEEEIKQLEKTSKLPKKKNYDIIQRYTIETMRIWFNENKR